MTVRQTSHAIERYLAGLPAEFGKLVRERVTFVVRDQPAPAELELGVMPTWRGAFLGQQCDDETDGQGVVCLYLGNMREPDELEEVLGHELLHFLGADEDDVECAGFGEHMGLAERAAAW